ncbi:spore germination protein [Alicyclobacillus sp. SO9]|uniref:spore germination protein n=1 Tax=Alicyclobacillus sp. SO9 TaxID=2665646 RepID=UPI0018E819B9|nr:spore germination protein [Alicyclobacillus sp. SO9]QQE80959.1 spore germination protein [Alicyclobacillus sp. SO9]
MSYRGFFNVFSHQKLRHRGLEPQNDDLSGVLDKNIDWIEEKVKSVSGNAADIVFRRVELAKNSQLLIIYVTGLVDTKTLNETVLKPLVIDGPSAARSRWMPNGVFEFVTKQLVPIANVKNVNTLGGVIDGLLTGHVAIIGGGTRTALLAEMAGWPVRPIEESQSEPSVQGPHEAFNETLRDTTALIRRRLRDARLRTEAMIIGESSKTDVAILYLSGVAEDSVLEEVHQRLKNIRLSSVFDAHYIEEFLEDSPLSPYPQVQNTERPDVVAAALLEGKIAIAVDGTPTVLLVPMTFWNGFQAPDDYYQRPVYVTLIRWVRFIMLNLSIFLTPVYVALTSFHPQMLPTNLLITFAASHNGSPFPVVLEAFMMEIIFEGLREAGVRLPKAVGSAVSIVGGLVVGQAAVEAGIVSAPTVIVVAMSGIASFTIPRYNFGFSYRILRFFVLLLAGTVGLYGITLSFIVILTHQLNLRSFGVPYMSPLSPRNPKQLLDVLIRAPRRYLPQRNRPHQDNPGAKRRPNSSGADST